MSARPVLPAIGSVRAATAWLALVGVAVAAWWFLLVSERVMTTMQGEGAIAELMWLMMRPGSVLPYLGAALVMWVVMMVAMMTPAVMPMASVYRGLCKEPRRNLATFVFANGYLAAWAVFSIAAAVLQWFLHARGVLHGMSLAASARVAGGLLVFAGLYQLTPLKEACLAHCRSPLGYFLNRWQDGLGGAFRLGFRHGIFCIGCCWVLMLLMFAGGAMSVMTMALLAAFILAERLLPAGPWAARAPGVLMIGLGALLAAGA